MCHNPFTSSPCSFSVFCKVSHFFHFPLPAKGKQVTTLETFNEVRETEITQQLAGISLQKRLPSPVPLSFHILLACCWEFHPCLYCCKGSYWRNVDPGVTSWQSHFLTVSISPAMHLPGSKINEDTAVEL